MGFTGNERFPSRILFGKFKGRRYQEAREDAELMSWLEWLAESTSEQSSAMGRWYLKQLKSGCGLEDAAFLDLQFQEDAGGTSVAAGLVVFQQPEMELYQRLVEAARIAAAQREELEQEIATLQAEAERVAEEARELSGEVPF